MTSVSAITPDPKRDGRFVVEVDGETVASVSLDTIERLGLRVGAEYGETYAAELSRDAASLRTYDRALNMLALRARSVAELRRLLLRKGEEAEHVTSAIERLVRVGLLDDAQFARQFARSKALGSGLSKRRIQAELGRRSVAREVADGAIAEVFESEEVDQEANIDRVAAKKLRALAKLDGETQRRRLYAFLARRGFDSDEIKSAMRRLEAEEPSAE